MSHLFIFDLPRLSVDIDLNYIGAASRDVMLAERPKVEEAIRAVCAREGFMIRRFNNEHAGGKWSLRYESSVGQGGNLEVDLNYMFRIPLWPVVAKESCEVGSLKTSGIPILDIHELAAGKLAALMSRHASRDLFDAHLLLTKGNLDYKRLRLAFVLYGAMNRKDWRTVSINDVTFDPGELENQLIPMIRKNYFKNKKQSGEFTSALVKECRIALDAVLPLSKTEMEFLNYILDHGKIEPSLLTTDKNMAEQIKFHPLLQWKALNVRQHRAK